MADGTSVVSDRWGTSAGPRALRERSQYASRLRLPAAAENRRNCSQVSPCAGRLPSGRGPNADRPFDEVAPAAVNAERGSEPERRVSRSPSLHQGRVGSTRPVEASSRLLGSMAASGGEPCLGQS